MITCYLDTQDYSVLSDPRSANPTILQTRRRLQEFADEGTVRFVFSSIAVCESVAVTSEAAQLAEKRAELLGSLCRNNALIYMSRLLSLEAVALKRRITPSFDAIDPQGHWFPEIPSTDTYENPWAKVEQMAAEELQSMGLTRQQRRAATRKFIKHGKPRAQFEQAVIADSPKAMEEIMRRYPMKLEFAQVVTRYCLGKASETEYTAALMSTLRDPAWMMKWFTGDHSLASPISDIVRKPGREIAEHLRSLIAISTDWAHALKASGEDLNPFHKKGEIYRQWEAFVDRQLVSFVEIALKADDIDCDAIFAGDVDVYCPGIAAIVRSLFSSAWENVTGSRKEEPSDSQPVDALHALYAPYVDVFRADRFMAPLIQKQVARHGTLVVPRLSNLVEILERRIAYQASETLGQ